MCNPIGKYLPENAGIAIPDPETTDAVMELGLSRGLIDPWNEADLRASRQRHIEAYSPNGSTVVAARASRLRPHYQHVLYESSSDTSVARA